MPSSHGSENRAVPFLATFNRIEAFLRSELEAKKSDSFTWMLNQAEKKKVVSRNQAIDLKEFAELRNAISHGLYRDSRPIAEPLPETVAEIERMCDALLTPTTAIEVAGPQKIRIFSLKDDIHAPLSVIRETGISQFPVYEGGTCVGLLTTNMIAQWIATDLGDDDRLQATTVGEALSFAEKQDRAVFLPRTISAAATIDALTTPLDGGSLPRLAIITEDGKQTQRPLAVLTASDIPALFAAS